MDQVSSLTVQFVFFVCAMAAALRWADFLQELNDFTRTGKAQRMVNLIVLMSSGRVCVKFSISLFGEFSIRIRVAPVVGGFGS